MLKRGAAATNSTAPLGNRAASTDSSNQIVFCFNPLLFEHCGLLLNPPSGLTTASIMKLRPECGNVTSISLANWKDIAVNVLGLPELTAYSIFDVFFSISGGCLQGSPSYYGSHTEVKTISEYRQENNQAQLLKMGGSVDESRWPLISTSRMVSLPGLMLFLLTQLLLERPPRQPLGGISHEVVYNHVRQYLQDYIIAVAATRSRRVTIADALELRYLLREFVENVEQPFGTSLGFLWPRSEKSIDIAILSQYIRPRLTYPSAIKVSPESSQLEPFSNNMTIQNISDQVLCPSTVPDRVLQMLSSTYVIKDCVQCSIYIASALPATRLSNLTNCTVVLGPVNSVLCVDHCQTCNISALCGAIIVSNCVDVNFFVCTNTPPLLVVENSNASSLQNVRFAPYNSHYATLERDLAASGINPLLNLWNVGLPSRQYLLPPEKFTPVCFPTATQVSMTTMTTRTNPCALPEPYLNALTHRLQCFQDVSNDLQEAYTQLEEQGRQDLAESLRNKIHSLFLEWLQQSGQSNKLVELFRASSTSSNKQ
ncbi:unnamed protein product [Phytomonas sp. EM1]|nr:unnamed protein product [Phytomonas sp. EM1]|eukprot:CCW60916.1 unnamed protein product [Phytomonas sp. isolate EM1]